MKPLTIVFYTDSYVPAVDGVVTSIVNFSAELKRRGHKVYIFTSGDAVTKLKSRNKNVIVIKGIKFRNYPQYNLALFPFFSSLKLYKINPDIIHVQTPFTMGLSGLASAKLSRIPVVSSFHTLFMDKSILKEYAPKNKYIKNLFFRYSWKYTRFFYNSTSNIIVPSDSIRKLLQKHGIKSEIHIVPNGLNQNYFNANVHGAALRQTLFKGKHDKIVLYAGRLSREKKLEVLIKAAKILDTNIKFVIVGDGPAGEYYKEMVKRSGLQDRFKFIGFVTHKNLGRYYAACDLFCIPSTFETQGLVALEAMACGKPVVGASRLALKDIIKKGKNGELFLPNDYKSCARKIRKVLNNTKRYKYTVETARNYSVEKMTDKLISVYKKVIASNNKLNN